MSDCPCGCGTTTPTVAHNAFLKGDPYWEWVCPNIRCPKWQTRMMNQTGDRQCSWCRRDRRFVGHFLPGGRRYDRTTVTGKAHRELVHGEQLYAYRSRL